jgi:hypothetical protein
MNTKFHFVDLNICLQTNVNFSYRPKWSITFPSNFELKSTYMKNGWPTEQKAIFKGSFIIDKISQSVTRTGAVQNIYLKPKDWILEWTRP